jgi:N utilization substance protein B
MALPQQKTREIIFQLLYSYDLGKAQSTDMLPLLMKELAVTRKAIRDAQEKVDSILSKQTQIDDLIAKTSYSYAFERIQSVERNILRVGIFELLYDKSIPPKVAISEAMRLARKFSTPESATFVNAILDSIYKSSEGIKIDAHVIEDASQALLKSEDATKNVSENMIPDDHAE